MTTPQTRTPSKKLFGANAPNTPKRPYGTATPALCKAVVDTFADNTAVISVAQAARIITQNDAFKHLDPKSIEVEFSMHATEEQKEAIKILCMARPTKIGRVINAVRKLGELRCVQSIPEAAAALERLGYYFKEDGEHAIKAGTVKVYWAEHADDEDWQEGKFVRGRSTLNPELPEHDVLMVNRLIERAGKNATLEDLAIAFNCTEEQLIAHLQSHSLDDIAAE
jgi:hypothetical protein